MLSSIIFIIHPIFSTIEDEATISGKRVVNKFTAVKSQIDAIFQKANGVTFDTPFSDTLSSDRTALLAYRAEINNGATATDAFAKTMTTASTAAQELAKSGNVNIKAIADFTSQQKQSQVTILAQNKSLGNVRTLLNEYNSSLSETANGVTNCGLKQADFVNSVGQSNTVLGKYLTSLNGADATMGGYVSSLIKAKASTIGLQIATTALNAVISMGISFLVSGAVQLLDLIKTSLN